MRSNRRSAVAAFGNSHVCAFHAHARELVRAWSARASDSRAVAAADGRFERCATIRSTRPSAAAAARKLHARAFHAHT
eukprot:209671-Lingulodinium_polyedra.AAC.1